MIDLSEDEEDHYTSTKYSKTIKMVVDKYLKSVKMDKSLLAIALYKQVFLALIRLLNKGNWTHDHLHYFPTLHEIKRVAEDVAKNYI